MLNFLGVAGLVGLGLCALVLGALSLVSDSHRDGGRVMFAMMAAVPLLVTLLASYGVALERDGFGWIWPGAMSGMARGALVLAAAVCTAAVALACMALVPEPASQVPWALRPLRHWATIPLLAALVLAPLMALAPGLRAAVPAAAWQWPVLAAGALSMLAGAGLLAQALQSQAASTQARATEEQAFHDRRDQAMLVKVERADPVTELHELLNHSSRFEAPAIRERALQRIALHPDLTRGIDEALRNGWADSAFAYLEAEGPPAGSDLSEAVRIGLEQTAQRVRREVANAHTLHPDDFDGTVRRVLGAVKAMPGHDFTPALRDLRAAFDEPRRDRVDFRAARALDEHLRQDASKAR